jgi:hypothetical protein
MLAPQIETSARTAQVMRIATKDRMWFGGQDSRLR